MGFIELFWREGTKHFQVFLIGFILVRVEKTQSAHSSFKHHSLVTFFTSLDMRNEKVAWKLEVRRNIIGPIALLSWERRYPFISLWLRKDALDMLSE